MTGGVLVVGEALVDIVETVDGRTAEVVGGSPANVALGLARQGVGVRLLTALGRDTRGDRVAAHLNAAGVVIDDASRSLRMTSTARARILADGSAQYDFDVTWTLPEGVEPAGAKLVHVGSIAAFLDPGATTLERLLDKRDERTIVTFDPNIRPALVGDQRAAKERFERLATRSDVVKLSDEDAAWLYPGLSVREVSDAVLDLGPRLVAITQGSRGALLRAGSVSVSVEAPKVTVRDTVGAGDTFMAALISQVLTASRLLLSPTPGQLEEAGLYAVAAAALTVQRVGADLPTAMEISQEVRVSARRARVETEQ